MRGDVNLVREEPNCKSTISSIGVKEGKTQLRTYSRCARSLFFQAEDGIRSKLVTGVQTCALPIWLLDLLTDETNGLRLIVSRLGAELISVARRNPAGNWIGFLNRDNEIGPPEKGWANHATVMGYYLHRIKDERSLYRGREIRGGTHSFLRGKVWPRGESQRDDELVYGITPNDFSATEYPLRVSLDLTYRIGGRPRLVAFRFRNEVPELTAHVGFGLHPGFAATSFESFHF